MKIKVVNRGSQPLPAYATALSAGMDLRANIEEPIVLRPMERRLIPTGLYIALPPGFEAQVRPRSGLALKHGITVLNAPGTIDADYRGEVGVLLINLSQEAFTINNGERILAEKIGCGAEQIRDLVNDALGSFCAYYFADNEKSRGGEAAADISALFLRNDEAVRPVPSLVDRARLLGL